VQAGGSSRPFCAMTKVAFMAEKTIKRNTTEARAATTGHNASTVLVVSTIAVIVAFAVVYFVYFAH
jgi:hypothetical protein